MSIRIMRIREDGVVRVFLVKPNEEEPDVWGTIGEYATVEMARTARQRMMEQQARSADSNGRT